MNKRVCAWPQTLLSSALAAPWPVPRGSLWCWPHSPGVVRLCGLPAPWAVFTSRLRVGVLALGEKLVPVIQELVRVLDGP